MLSMVFNPRLNYERFLMCSILVFICSIVSRRLCVEQSQSLASTSIVLSELRIKGCLSISSDTDGYLPEYLSMITKSGEERVNSSIERYLFASDGFS